MEQKNRGGEGDFEHTLAMMIKLTNLSEVTKRSVSSNFSKKKLKNLSIFITVDLQGPML